MTAASAAAISFSCAACGKTLRVPVTRAGQTGPCPGCGESVTVPPARSGSTAELPAGRFDPENIDHVPMRIPFYAEKVIRRQKRLDQYLTRAEAREFVLRQYHEHVLQMGTLVLIGFLVLAGMSAVMDGLGGAAIMVGQQFLWALPMCSVLYILGRFLLVPPVPKDAP